MMNSWSLSGGLLPYAPGRLAEVAEPNMLIKRESERLLVSFPPPSRAPRDRPEALRRRDARFSFDLTTATTFTATTVRLARKTAIPIRLEKKNKEETRARRKGQRALIGTISG